VLQKVGEKRQLINHLSERPAKWIGHVNVMRGDTLLKNIHEEERKERSK